MIFVIVILGFLFQATIADTNDTGKICLRPEVQEAEFYDEALEKGQLDIREKNAYVFKEISFKIPMVVLGWEMSGKNGLLQGNGTGRRGLITEYNMKFLSQTGDWSSINNSKTGNEVFRSNGNLANPDAITQTVLANPITTMVLRLYPQLWEGMPYLMIKINICRPEIMSAPSGSATTASNDTGHTEGERTNTSIPVNKNDLSGNTATQNISIHPIAVTSETSTHFEIFHPGHPTTTAQSTVKGSDIKPKDEEHSRHSTESKPQITTNPGSNDDPDNIKERHCTDRPTWRYSQTSVPPKDTFLATGDEHHAWRSMGGLLMEPFKFNLKARNRHQETIKKIYLQVTFQKLTAVFGIRISGSSLPDKWGCITKFAVLYKMANQMNWVFYRDEFGASRVFDMGERSMGTCSEQLTFSLPVPIKTTAIRIYPEHWANQPMIHVNFLTCNLEGINCIKPLLADGKLQRLQFEDMDPKLQEKNSLYFTTITISTHTTTKILAVSFKEGARHNSVTKFVLQFHDEAGNWFSVNDKNGEIMMFSTADVVHESDPITVFFNKPVIVKSMRLYPQRWEGINPTIKIDFLGCRMKTPH